MHFKSLIVLMTLCSLDLATSAPVPESFFEILDGIKNGFRTALEAVCWSDNGCSIIRYCDKEIEIHGQSEFILAKEQSIIGKREIC
eukprot:TCALIF_13646-PA protein Name:"Protein of unknown function" AED:0.08 eAED:0.08 QI:78/1/0.5/1/0/0.5/2/0/85